MNGKHGRSAERLGAFARRGLRPGSPAAFGFALLCVGVATLLRLSIDLFAPDAIPYATYFPAILIAALISGLGGGVFALALSALTAWYVFVPPRMSFAGWDVEHSVSLGLFFFTAIAVVSFLLTVELRRWSWSILFAVGWGAVIALVGWFTAQYNQVPEIFEFPFFSGILAVLIAAPLFQTIRDEGAWRFPYARLHRHAWTDAVIGAASLAFTGITFMLAWLIASLFGVMSQAFGSRVAFAAAGVLAALSMPYFVLAERRLGFLASTR